MHFLSPFFTEPLLQHFNLINISLQHQLFRDKRCPCIELFHKIQKDLRWCGICCDPQIEMISSDHFTFPDKKHLYHCIFFIHRHRDHILILSLTSGDFLALTDLLYTLHQIPIFSCFLKAQIFRCREHLLFQFFQKFFVIPIQKIQYTFNLFLIFFFGNITLAGCLTLFDMIVETGTFFADIPGQIPVTGTDMIQFPDQFHRIFHCCGTGIRSEISGLILFHSPHEQYPGIFLIDRYFQIRISLIIFKHGIVFGPVFFNQITFQYQCFQLGICNNILKPCNLLHHLFFFDSEISAALEILPHPVFQADGFSHIDDRILRIVHNINPRFPR